MYSYIAYRAALFSSAIHTVITTSDHSTNFHDPRHWLQHIHTLLQVTLNDVLKAVIVVFKSIRQTDIDSNRYNDRFLCVNGVDTSIFNNLGTC